MNLNKIPRDQQSQTINQQIEEFFAKGNTIIKEPMGKSGELIGLSYHEKHKKKKEAGYLDRSEYSKHE